MTDRALRRKHALQELQARKVVGEKGLPLFVRCMLALFPNQANPYYGSRVLYGFQLGLVFALPFVALITAAFAFDKEMNLPWEQALMIGLAIGGVGGAGFGGVMAFFKRNVHKRMNLTPWAQLDKPPVLDQATDGESFEEISAQWEAAAGITSLTGTVARRNVK